MLFSTTQMAPVHSRDDGTPRLSNFGEALELIKQTKLLGIFIDEHLKWDEEVKQLCKSSHAILGLLRKIKHFADFNLKKQLVESLIFSKIDYYDSVFHPLPDFLMKRLQRLQFAAASYVTGRYIRECDDILGLVANEREKRS